MHASYVSKQEPWNQNQAPLNDGLCFDIIHVTKLFNVAICSSFNSAIPIVTLVLVTLGGMVYSGFDRINKSQMLANTPGTRYITNDKSAHVIEVSTYMHLICFIG